MKGFHIPIFSKFLFLKKVIINISPEFLQLHMIDVNEISTSYCVCLVVRILEFYNIEV